MADTTADTERAGADLTDDEDFDYFELTEDEQRALRPARLAKAAATHLTLPDLTAELHRLSERDTVRLTRKLKKSASAPTSAIAQAVRTALARITEEGAAGALHDALHSPILAAGSTRMLETGELAALLAADGPRLGFLVDHENLRDDLAAGQDAFGVSAGVRAAVWSSMICTGHEGAVAALGWLVADPPEFWTDPQRETVRGVWAQVRDRLPELPAEPVSLQRLCDVVADLERSGEIDALADAGRPDEAVDEPAQISDLTDQLTALADRHAAVRDGALAEIATEMAAGRVPPPLAMEQLVELATDMLRALNEVAAVTGSPVRDTLAQALEDLDAAASAHTAADVLARVARLRGLRAPEYVAVEAKQVAERATAADADTDPAVLAALDALVTAIDLGGTDPQRATDLVRIVQTGLPSAAVLVMLAGNPGTLTLEPVALDSAADGEGDADIPTPAAAAVTADSTGTDDDSTVGTGTGTDGIGTDGIGTDDTGTDDNEGAPPEPAATGPVSVEHDSHPAAEVAEDGRGADAADLPVRGTPVIEPTVDEILAGLDLTIPDEPASSAAPAAPAATASARTETAPVVLDVPAAAEADDTPAVDVDALYTRLMAAHEYSLAGWLADSVAAPPVATAAHRLAAHAAAMRTSTGPNAAAFKDLVGTLDAGALRDAPGAQMLVYAASVRAGLLSPTAGAADPLRDMCPAIVKSGPAIEELTDALLTCIYSGAYLTPRSADAAADAANLESEYATLVDTARTLLDTASSRNIRYAAATELYKAWMAPTGYLGAALTLAASGSRRPEDLKFVRKRVTELRSRSELETAIDRDTPGPAHAKRSRRIEARARDKVIEWAGDVADVLAQWVETTENLTQSTSTGWMSSQVGELRARVATLRDAALGELRRLAGSGPETRTAAVAAGLELLESSLDLLTAGAQLPADAELPADRVANGMLALAADLPLQLTPTLTPRRTVTVADIDTAAAALGADTAGWTAAFNRRTELADHVGTQVILDMLRSADPQLARRLAAIRDRDVAAAAERLDGHVAALAGRIDSDRRFGRLSGDAWSALSIRARAFEADARAARRDFDVMEAELLVIEEACDKHVAATIEAKWQQLADLQSAITLTDEQAGRISDCIAAEDITTADEYIETVRSRRELPAPRTDTDHLAQFFAAFPAMFAAAAAARGPAALSELRRAIDAGRNPATGPLAALLAGASIDVARIEKRPTASSRLEQWANLASARTLDGKLAQVKPVLEQLGFIVAKANTPNHRKGQVPGASSWMHLTGVRNTEGSALIPAFGSKISPTGDTLRVLAVWGSPTPGRLVELLKDEPTDHAVLVLYFGALGVDARRELATLMRSGPKVPTTAVVDDAAYGYVSVQPTPRRDTTMAITLPFAASAPFTPDVAGLVPVEMFYGRTDELDQVTEMMGSCIVYGGRQLGKSALLRAAARKFAAGEHREAIYQSIYKVGQGTIAADKVWTTLWPRLAEKRIVPSEDLPNGDVSAAVIGHITSWVNAVPGRQLLLLLDESDFFLDADASKGKFTHVAAFRELMEQTERAFKVVFAGLHQTARFERLANHPLAHFGSPVCVGPLSPQHAYELLTDPLRALGFRFADDNVAARVLALANNQPSLIQLFGAKLLTHLQRSGAPATLPQRVTADDIEAVWSDESLREAFRKRFDWTLNLDPRYKIIAYTVAYHAHAHGVGSALTPTELRSQCEQWWPQGFAAEDVRTGEFRALLDECVALGVLSYAPAEGAYRLRTPNVLALLGSRDEVDDVLDAAESTPLPDSFDGSLLRPPYAGNVNTRSPLTSAQIADLLAARNQVRVIAGTDALTVARCARVLRDENEHAVYGARSIPIKDATAANFELTCQGAARTAWHTVVLADLSAVSHAAALEAWDKARDAIAARHGGTLGIVLITGPEQAPLWVRATAEADAASSLTALHRYDNTGLRLWLPETTLPFQDDATRADLLEVTGGWPALINRVAAGADSDSDALEGLRTWLAQPAHADEFVDSLGVRVDDVLRAGWAFLLTALSGDDAADARTLAELMAIAAGEDTFAALRPDRLAAGGYGSTDAVVDVFRTLGVLVVSADDGQLRLEPVAVAAAAAAGSGTP